MWCSPEVDNLQVFECGACVNTQIPKPLEVSGIQFFGTSQCCLPCQHPVIEFGPTLPTMAVTLSVLAPLQIEYDRTGALCDFLKATYVFDKLAWVQIPAELTKPLTGSPQTTRSKCSVHQLGKLTNRLQHRRVTTIAQIPETQVA